MNLLWAVALACLVLYLLVASSNEFRDFAPRPVNDPILYATVAVAGILIASATHRESTLARLFLFFLVLAVPVLIYGATLVYLWVEIGGRGLMDYFILEAARRSVVYLAMVGVVGGFGIALGLFVSEMRG